MAWLLRRQHIPHVVHVSSSRAHGSSSGCHSGADEGSKRFDQDGATEPKAHQIRSRCGHELHGNGQVRAPARQHRRKVAHDVGAAARRQNPHLALYVLQIVLPAAEQGGKESIQNLFSLGMFSVMKL